MFDYIPNQLRTVKVKRNKRAPKDTNGRRRRRTKDNESNDSDREVAVRSIMIRKNDGSGSCSIDFGMF